VSTVAEKFETMVKLETRNSRMKDFHDVCALATAFALTECRCSRPLLPVSIVEGHLDSERPVALTPAF